ncbi:MAG: ester cyclase [Solirubrobacteraceae bacterium]
MSADENVAAVRDFIERAWNAGDEAVFEEHLAADIAHPGGRDGFKAMVLGFRSAFADLAMEVRDIFGVEDKVVTRWTMRGTHEAAFLGIAPTGRPVEFDGIAIDIMRDGQRIDGWAQFDRMGLLIQLGAIDPSKFGPPGNAPATSA